MSFKNDERRYGLMARGFHWLVFLALAAMVWLGLEFTGMPRGDERTATAALHKALGVVVLGIMVLRLAWRILDLPPEPQPGPRWQTRTAHFVHWLLYAMIFGQLLTGLFAALTGGRPVAVFGLFSIPGLERDEDLHHLLEEVHEWGWRILAGVVGVHVLAALYRQFVTRDGTLKRMITGAAD